MKVLLINGSPRDNGNTFTALSEVAKTLNGEGIETEIISIGSLRPFEQVFHNVEYAPRQFAVLEHGLWSDARTGRTG